MEIGVVGAGAAAATAAHALRDHDVTVFEKSRGVCGRAATRRRNGCVYDYGANYVKSKDPRVNDLLTETLNTRGLVDVAKPVWTFDADGRIAEGRDDEAHKWTYESGITQLAKRLFDRAGTSVRRETRVGSLAREGDRWVVHDDTGDRLGTFDIVLLNPPGPQTADILRASEWNDDRREAIITAADSVSYRTIYTGVFNYEFKQTRPWYALVNTDREHEVGWLAREECKDRHVPEGESLLIAQMAPGWSERRYNDDPEAVCADIADLVAELLDDARFADPVWTDQQRWRYALADDAVDEEIVRSAEDAGLFFTGDWIPGEGRVHLAMRDGLEVAERIAQDR